MSLDFDPERLREIIYKAADIVVGLYKGINDRKVFQAGAPEEIKKLFSESLPEKGRDFEEVLSEIGEKVIDTATMNISPRFHAYYTGGGNQAAIPAELISVALNQNALKWHCSPSCTEMERQVVRWIAEFIGYSQEAGGYILSGGSVANFVCLAVARKIKSSINVADDGLYASPVMTIYVSEEGHSSIDKAVDMLGLGRKNLRKIPVKDDLTININALKDQIIKDSEAGLLPICAIGIAGTTNTGAVDPLEELAKVCSQHNLWFHVDAAYGGPAAATESAGNLFRGMEKADSIVIDPHKWMYIPFEAGCVLVKNEKHLRDTFSLLPDYLRADIDKSGRYNYMEYTFELTRNFHALKIWTTFKLYGAGRIRETIEEDIQNIRYLADLIDESDDFERLSQVPLSVVCFRYRTGDETKHEDDVFLDELNQKLIARIEEDGRFFVTGTKIKSRTALRVVCINHRTTKKDLDILINVIREMGNDVKNELT
jgi:aromatic-L-amino-acid decarboxylase